MPEHCFNPGDNAWHEFNADTDLFPEDTDLVFPEDTDRITSHIPSLGEHGPGDLATGERGHRGRAAVSRQVGAHRGGRVSRGFLREHGGQGRGAAGLSGELPGVEGQGARGRGAATVRRSPGLLHGGRRPGRRGLGGRVLGGLEGGQGFGVRDLGGQGLGVQGLVGRGQRPEVRGRRGLRRGEVLGARGASTAPQPRSRHPTAGAPNQNLDLMDPDEYLAINSNANTKKNIEHAAKTYDRVMAELADQSGEHFESLQEAPLTRLPYLLLKFLQTAKTLTGGVFASGTMNTLFNGISSVLMRREEEPVNVKIDPRFKKVQEMLKVRCSVSASEGRGTGCDAKRPVTQAHLAAALQAGTIGREAPKPLLTAVYLSFVMGMGCRTGTECHMIQNGDLTFGPLSTAGYGQT